MPKYNVRLIKSRRSYSMSEIASLLGIDRKTCHRWIKEGGLGVIEEGVNPLLVMGANLIDFLKGRRAKRSVLLGENEFLCMKCHKAVKARVGTERIVKTGKMVGKNNLEQLKRVGACEVCGTTVNVFLRVSRQDYIGYP